MKVVDKLKSKREYIEKLLDFVNDKFKKLYKDFMDSEYKFRLIPISRIFEYESIANCDYYLWTEELDSGYKKYIVNDNGEKYFIKFSQNEFFIAQLIDFDIETKRYRFYWTENNLDCMYKYDLKRIRNCCNNDEYDFFYERVKEISREFNIDITDIERI